MYSLFVMSTKFKESFIHAYIDISTLLRKQNVLIMQCFENDLLSIVKLCEFNNNHHRLYLQNHLADFCHQGLLFRRMIVVVLVDLIHQHHLDLQILIKVSNNQFNDINVA